jgi:hypothetical protein
MEDQGIMALPQGQAMQGPTAAPPGPKVTPEAEAAFEAARMQVDPVEFGDELLSQAEKADPETVAEFRRLLDESNLPPEVIDALGEMVDKVLAEPEKYKENREKFVQEGVPEDFLPMEFDAAFFGALNMALDQLNADLSPAPQRFAMGGEVKMNPIASGIAQLGRNGDSQLAHITMSERRMLRRAGGSGTINPATGLPEYGISSVFKKVGNAFKKVGNAISSAVKGVVNGVKKFAKSTVGRIITTIALGFFLGPAAASLMGVGAGSVVGTAISGFVGGFGSSLLAGDNVKTALRNGAIGGITAGAMSGVTGSSFYTPSTTTASEALAGQVSKFTEGIGSLTGGAPAQPTTPAPSLAAQVPDAGLPPPIEAPQFTASAQPGTDMASMAGRTATDITAPTTGQLGPTTIQQTPTDFMQSIQPRAMGAQLPPGYSVMGPATGQPFAQPYADIQSVSRLGDITQAAQPYSSFQTPSMGTLAEAAPSMAPTPEPGMFDRATDFFKRNIMPSGIEEAGKADALLAYNQTLAETGDAALAREAYKKALPGAFAKYTPMLLAGTGILGAAGGFQAKDPGRPGLIPTETGVDLLKKYPERYGVRPGGGNIVYGGYGTIPPGFAKGGIADLPEKFPRKNGPIDGPGTGTSDSIPAMLSDGEFVFTAKAVRAMGNGSRRKGAKRMYALMKKLEGRK